MTDRTREKLKLLLVAPFAAVLVTQILAAIIAATGLGLALFLEWPAFLIGLYLCVLAACLVVVLTDRVSQSPPRNEEPEDDGKLRTEATCPECGETAKTRVRVTSFKAHRFRCQRCGHEWFVG